MLKRIVYRVLFEIQWQWMWHNPGRMLPAWIRPHWKRAFDWLLR